MFSYNIVYAEDGFEDFETEKTGWYTWNFWTSDITKDVYDIYYLDDKNEIHKPSQRKLSWHTRKSVYLVTGIVYKIPEGVKLVEVDSSTLTEKLETMLADYIYSIANGLHYLISAALGETITIDDLVFNNYAETNISYFASKDEVGADMASSLIYGSNGVGGLDTVVNAWYSIFRRIALMGYMAILVYMGIRILLRSNSREKGKL